MAVRAITLASRAMCWDMGSIETAMEYLLGGQLGHSRGVQARLKRLATEAAVVLNQCMLERQLCKLNIKFSLDVQECGYSGWEVIRSYEKERPRMGRKSTSALLSSDSRAICSK